MRDKYNLEEKISGINKLRSSLTPEQKQEFDKDKQRFLEKTFIEFGGRVLENLNQYPELVNGYNPEQLKAFPKNSKLILGQAYMNQNSFYHILINSTIPKQNTRTDEKAEAWLSMLVNTLNELYSQKH